MDWINHNTYRESADGMYQIRAFGRGENKRALYRWDERYQAHTRLVGQGTEEKCKGLVDAVGD